ncbi:MAG: hypothetical protein ACXQTL_06015 [Methanosarcinales archaeon]
MARSKEDKENRERLARLAGKLEEARKEEEKRREESLTIRDKLLGRIRETRQIKIATPYGEVGIEVKVRLSAAESRRFREFFDLYAEHTNPDTGPITDPKKLKIFNKQRACFLATITTDPTLDEKFWEQAMDDEDLIDGILLVWHAMQGQERRKLLEQIGTSFRLPRVAGREESSEGGE